MKILTAAGQAYSVTVDDSWTVRDLNEAITEIVHIPVDKQHLQYRGRDLCCTRTDLPLSHYGIANDAELMLLGKLKGGKNMLQCFL